MGGMPSANLEQTDWRWYEDDASGDPSVALANENVKPTLPGDQNYTVIRLRVVIQENGGAAANNQAFGIDYTEDGGTNWHALGAASTEDTHLVYGNGGGTDNSSIAANLISTGDALGLYHESAGNNESIAANSNHEMDVAIYTRVLLPDTDYQFRITLGGTAVTVKTGSTAIQLRGSTAATREVDGNKNTVVDMSAQDDPDPATLSHGHHKKGFYDGTRWWAFYIPDETANSIAYKSSSALASAWSSESTVTLTTSGFEDFSVIFKNKGGTLYVFLATFSSSTSWRLKRGTISGATITWDSTERNVTVPASDNTGSPNLIIDSADHLWFVGTNTGSNQIWAQSSVNTIDNATYYTFNTAKTLSETMGGGANASGDSIELVDIGSSSILAVWWQASTSDLRAAKVSESGGFGTAQTASATGDAHSNDWAIATDGTDVYLLHGDATTNGYNWVLRVYSISGDSWSTGTSPSVSKASDATANDGVVLHWGDDGNLYAAGTFTGTSSRDTEIQYKKYTGGTSGTWDSGLTELTPTTTSTIGNGDSISCLVGGPAFVVLIERGDDQLSGTFYLIEYYHTATEGAAAEAFPPFPRRQLTTVRM